MNYVLLDHTGKLQVQLLNSYILLSDKFGTIDNIIKPKTRNTACNRAYNTYNVMYNLNNKNVTNHSMTFNVKYFVITMKGLTK